MNQEQWKIGKKYECENDVIYDKKTYICLQTHISQSDWTPSTTHSLWQLVSSVTDSLVTDSLVTDLSSINFSNNTVLSPYLYSWGFNNKSYKISKCMDIINILKGNAVTLGFVINASGNSAIDLTNTFKDDINKFVSKGGRLIISCGGANGPYLEEKLLFSQMVLTLLKLIEATKCTGLDFNIEGKFISDNTLNDKRSKVISAIQKRHPGFYISFTLPADMNGLTQDGLNVIDNAIRNGINISIVNAMIMDIGALPKGKTWSQCACEIGDVIIQQLKTFYPNKQDDQLYRMLGLTPMIGNNDDGTTFTIDDATILGKYAKKNNIGLLSFWAINRDQAGVGGLNIYSQVNKVNYEYYNAFKKALDI